MDEDTHPPIVGIGASAGGVKALQTFFDAIPVDSGAAYVVIVHLDPDARSELAPILGNRTQMPCTRWRTRRS
jgi:two-component system CheB/CheR fusion protein